MKFTRQEHAYNVVSCHYIHASECPIDPFPLSPAIKRMHTINVNVICEYQGPVISTIVAVDTLR